MWTARLCALAVLLALLLPVQASRDCYGALVEVAINSSRRTAAVYGYPALWGRPVNATASRPLPLAFAHPRHACGPVVRAPTPGAAALVARGNCTFTDKARHLVAAGFSAMLLDSNSTEDCVLMFPANRSDAEGLSGIAGVSLTSEAGTLLAGMLEADPQTTTASLRQPEAGGGLDVSSMLLWLLACSTVAAGAALAGRDYAAAGSGSKKGGRPAAAQQQGGGDERLHITAAGAVWFALISSAMLLLLFFFLDALTMALVVLFALGASQALASLLAAGLARVCPPGWQALYAPRLPLVGSLPVLQLGSGIGAGALGLVWLLCRHALWAWVLQDLLAVALMLVILRTLLLPNLKVAAILLPLAFCYDVWWVFLQPAVTGGPSVMVEVATGGPSHEMLPMVLKVPRLPLLGTNPAYSLLGLGDVVLPGLLAVLCARFDVAAGLPWAAGFAAPCLAGYASGLGLTYAALYFSWFGDQGQPALLYLVPCTLGVVATLAWRRRQLAVLWACDLEGGSGSGGGGSGGGSAGDRGAAAAAASSMEAGEERRGLLQPS